MIEPIARDGELTIRRLHDDPDDFARLARWRSMPHVHEWWNPDDPPPTADEMATRYRERTDPDPTTTACIFELDGRAIGYLQFYRWADFPEVPVSDDQDVWGIDLHVGEPDVLGKGYGTRTVALICRYLAADRGARAVALTTELANTRAQRAYEKAGFAKVHKVLDTDTRDGERVWCWLMRWESNRDANRLAFALMPATGDLDRQRIVDLHARELQRFRDAIPNSLALIARARAHMPNGTPMSWMAADNDQPVYIDRGEGPGFTDVDGRRYVDFNASDLAMFCGHANPAIVRAVQERAARSTQFLLPTEDSIWVAEELARRYPGQTHWQFTLSATQANTEAIRLARAVTGRDVVVLFQGHYHGHFEEALVDLQDGEVVALERGLSKAVTGRVRIAGFNDTGSLRAALDPGDVALVLAEPAMTNNLHLLPPRERWHDALRALTNEAGALLALDETHTHVVGYGGASGLWELHPDIITIGKAVAGGVPMGTYGVTPQLAERLDIGEHTATGGTLFGNPLSAAAARAALGEVLVPQAYEHTSALGARLADGIEGAIRANGLPWTAIRFGPRSGQWYGPQPATSADAVALTDKQLTRLIRVYLANRGIWEALPGAGPTVPVPATEADVELYLAGYEELLAELTA